MIPLRDTTKSGTFPIVNTAFIAINIAVFIFVWFLIQFLGGISSAGRAADAGVLHSGHISEVLLQA